MKKVFSIILLAVSLFLGSQAVSMNEAMAQDVWAYSSGDTDYYIWAPVKHVERENGFMCSVKIVHKGKFHSMYRVKFVYAKSLNIHYYRLDQRNGKWEFGGNIRDNPLMEAIYETGNKY